MIEMRTSMLEQLQYLVDVFAERLSVNDLFLR